jgi:hypothetical protein
VAGMPTGSFPAAERSGTESARIRENASSIIGNSRGASTVLGRHQEQRHLQEGKSAASWRLTNDSRDASSNSG